MYRDNFTVTELNRFSINFSNQRTFLTTFVRRRKDAKLLHHLPPDNLGRVRRSQPGFSDGNRSVPPGTCAGQESGQRTAIQSGFIGLLIRHRFMSFFLCFSNGLIKSGWSAPIFWLNCSSRRPVSFLIQLTTWPGT